MRKVIWSCWFQGRENAPEIAARCLTSWEARNPDWTVCCLDAKTLRRYVDIDDHIGPNSRSITAASLSDIVRILLLHKYGGTWVDATTYCSGPIDEWLPLVAGTGFFAFANPGPGRPLATWFLAAAPENALVAKWAVKTIEYWRDRTPSNDYFWFHHLFAELCVTDSDARAAWERVPKISADGPHAIQAMGMHRPAAEVYSKIDWTIPVFKLTHRVHEDALASGSLLNHVLNRHGHMRPKRTAEEHEEPKVSSQADRPRVKVE